MLKVLKHDNITSTYLKGYSFKTAKKNLLVFTDEESNILTIDLLDRNIIIQSEKDNYYRKIIIQYPEEKNASVKCEETNVEERENGRIVEKVVRFYGYTVFSKDTRYLTDIYSKRYVLDKTKDNIDLSNDELLDQQSRLITDFYCGMKHLISDGNRFYTDSATSTKTILNDADISRIYAIVEGPNKVERIYDLYNGKVTEDNLYDLMSINLGFLSKDAYDYKEKAAITAAEDFLIGKTSKTVSERYKKLVMDFVRNSIKYPYEFDLTDREEFIKVLTYSPKAVEVCKNKLEKLLGISYQEFEQLDMNLREEIIKEARNKNNLTDKESELVTEMMGNGEHAIFLKRKKGTKVGIGSGEHLSIGEAGLTKDEFERKRDKKIHDLFYKKSGVKEKIKSIFRKN